MLRMSAFVAALLLGWGLSRVAWSQEKPAYRGALPPSAADTLREAKIEAILRQPCTLDIDESSLQDAVDYFRQKFDIEVALDQKALGDAGIDPSVSVTFHTKDLPAGSALDLLLEDFELAYAIQHGVLRITSKDKADTFLTTRVYPVADLIEPDRERRRQVGSHSDTLIELIQDTVRPESWQSQGGAGSIKQFRAPSGDLLVISNTRFVQAQVVTLLADLRAAKPAAGAIEKEARDPKALHPRIYRVGAVSGPDLVNVITAAIAKDTWSINGGAGLIWAIPASPGANTEAAVKAGSVIPPDWKLVVLQTDSVQRQVDELLAPLDPPLYGMGGIPSTKSMNGMFNRPAENQRRGSQGAAQ
jgi:hypothetical protein